MGWAMKRILVVQENPEVSALLSNALTEYAPYKVIASGDGTEAVFLLELHRPDLALIDLQMPGTQGIDVGERALALQVPVILMTDNFAMSQRLRLNQIPYLPKPFRISELFSTIEKELAVAASRQGMLHQSLLRLSANMEALRTARRDAQATIESSRREREDRQAIDEDAPPQ